MVKGKLYKNVFAFCQACGVYVIKDHMHAKHVRCVHLCVNHAHVCLTCLHHLMPTI